jgi:hypothetical protein
MSNDNLASKYFEGKPCRKCGSTRRYVKDKKCVDCSHESNQKYYQTNLEKISKKSHKRYQENPEKKRRNKKWQQENLEKCREYNRKHRHLENSCEHQRKYQQKYRKENPGKSRENNRISHIKTRAKRSGAEGFHSTQQWINLKEQYGNHCLDCGIHESKLTSRRKAERHLTPDHIIPLSRGGTNWISNIQPLCLPCNVKNWKHYLRTGYQIDFRNPKLSCQRNGPKEFVASLSSVPVL